MKPFAFVLTLLLISILFSCKKNKHDNIRYSSPEDTIRIRPVDPVLPDTANFITMKLDGKIYADSITQRSIFQKTSERYSLLEIRGSTGKDQSTKLFVGISIPDHKIKTGPYGKVKEGFVNTIQWVVTGTLDVFETYVADGNDEKHPSDPFMIMITRSDETGIEGYFSGRAYGKNKNDVLVAKDITEGHFRFATQNMKILN
jgi:hypothetical protein